MREQRTTTMEERLWKEPGRQRLVRLCAAISNDAAAAEDLAQETLLEAWRNLHKLHDPAGADRWLAAIARNVCHRWGRRRGRDTRSIAPQAVNADLPDDLDLEAEFERGELVELLDRALAFLPSETRAVLIHRYVDDAPHAEIAARLGISEDAVSMRLTRGKTTLRRLLGTQLREEATAHGLIADPGDVWQETRVWCAGCGSARLVSLDDARRGVLSFRCPACAPPGTNGFELPLGNPLFSGLVGTLVRPAAMLSRVTDWTRSYFGRGVAAGEVDCTRCGRAVAIERFVREDFSPGSATRLALLAACDACGEQVPASIAAVALGTPEVRALRRAHPRTRLLSTYDAGGAENLVVRYEAVSGSAGVDVVFARATLRLLAVRRGSR